jgi:uncharacterized protein (TIGR03643 family)
LAALKIPRSGVFSAALKDCFVLETEVLLSEEAVSRIIEMAWEDRTPFEAIETLFGLNESAVIRLMRKEMKHRSFLMWRERVSGRKTKHLALRSSDVTRSHCSRQYKHRHR